MTTKAITKWTIDPHHSEVGFKTKHLMITTVSGKFEKFEGSVETDGEDLATARITFSANADSINTGSEQRDGHLKGADFFEPAKYPTLKFTSNKFEKASENKYKLQGDLTIRNVTKPVTLDVEFAGFAKDPYGNTKAGFVVDGKINRKDWGLNWNVSLETGGWLVADEVKIHCEIQVTKVNS